MNKKRYRSFLWVCLIVSALCMTGLIYKEIKEQIPDEIHVLANRETDWQEVFDSPLVTYENAVEATQNTGYHIKCSILGIVPLKEVKVSTLAENTIYASGSPIGIYMETNGVMVIDSGEIRDADGILQSPADNIVKSGDYIQSVNHVPLQNKKDLIKVMKENQGEEVELEVLRHDEAITVKVSPILTEDGDYKLGIWVRDNVQGIGTLTYVTKDSQFGALGHGIRDVDTGEQLQIAEGNLYMADIVSIQKGVSGTPGELQGIISYRKENQIGIIDGNTENGIIGELDAWSKVELMPCPIGLKQELETGKAEIWCDLGDGVEHYEIEITQIDYNTKNTNKSFEIKVTDERLLAKTGGVVQGMSGSPIVQNGRIVGAVTHVFVNDPTRGYGIFVENMLGE